MKDKKIKVLRIIGECKTGGTETIVLNYYNNLDHSKIAMDFLFYGNSLPRFNDALEKNGDKVINVVDYSTNLIASIKQIRNIVKREQYDIVHAQLNTLNMFPLMGAWLGGAKVRIAANHSTANLKYEFKKSIIKYIIRPTAKIFATHYAACSKYAGCWCFGKRNLKKNKIKIIRNAVDLNKFTFDKNDRNTVREKMGWEKHYVIGHGGRFTEQKNHKFIVEIFDRVHKKCPNAILVFVGEGHLMNNIKNQVHALGLDDYVQFLGIRFDMDKLMQGFDVFLFPSLYEGLGNVITEAQAVGLRTVISDSVPKEVIMTKLVDVVSLNESSDVWAEKVLEYSNDYERMDTHIQLKAAGYEIKSATKDLIDYYNSLLDG